MIAISEVQHRFAVLSINQLWRKHSQETMSRALRKKNIFFVHDKAMYAKLNGFMTMIMKKNFITLVTVAGILGGIASVLAETKPVPPPPAPAENKDAKETSGAKIQFDEAIYDFGKVNSGEVVKHSFVFTNIGTTTLEIKDVRPGCGCTTAGTWDKIDEPGKTGSIPLQFNSANFGGMVTKSATVICNDPSQ